MFFCIEALKTCKVSTSAALAEKNIDTKTNK
jgi:hypothetical protein